MMEPGDDLTIDELLRALGRRCTIFVTGYRLKNDPGQPWVAKDAGSLDDAVGMARRVWHTLDQEQRKRADGTSSNGGV